MSDSRDNTVDTLVGDGVVPVTVPGVVVSTTSGVVGAASMGSTVVSHFHSSTVFFVKTAADLVLVVVVTTASGTSAIQTSSGNDKEATSFDTGLLSGRTGGELLTGGELSTRGDFLGPNSMSGFVPVSPRSVKSHGQTSVTFADSFSARRFPFQDVIDGLVKVIFTDDISLSVVSRFLFVVFEFEGIFLFVGNAFLVFGGGGDLHGEFFLGASVTEPQVLTGFVNQIDGSAFTRNERVSTFRQAPATVETISGDTFIFGLHPRNQLFQFNESLKTFHGV